MLLQELFEAKQPDIETLRKELEAAKKEYAQSMARGNSSEKDVAAMKELMANLRHDIDLHPEAKASEQRNTRDASAEAEIADENKAKQEAAKKAKQEKEERLSNIEKAAKKVQQ